MTASRIHARPGQARFTPSSSQDEKLRSRTAPRPPTFTAESPDYEKLRTRYFNDRVPNAKPGVIATPATTAEVSELIADAKAKGGKVGVRSGGHLFPAYSLIHGELLIDTSQLNQNIEYDPTTKILTLGPATRVRAVAEYLSVIGRFFPFGHHPSVGLCGFLLAGGQGWFMRGWGYTADKWIEQLEIVMPNSDIILANRKQNQDVFWAARGGGQGFFGVVTKIWVNTMPSKSLYHRTILLDASTDYQSQLKWVLKKCDATEKYGVDIAIVTSYSDLLEEGDHWETQTNRLLLMIELTTYADSLEEAAIMTSPWDSIEDDVAQNLILQSSTTPTTWEELFEMQDKVFPARDRWQCDSILTRVDTSYDEIAELSRKAMYDLPNRKCVGTICVTDYYPDEANQALSLHQRHYISSMTRWKDAEEDEKYSKWMQEAYKPLERISVGQYIADLDVNQRTSTVMTDSALRKWLSIRQKWDPEEMFPGYHGLKSVSTDHSIRE